MKSKDTLINEMKAYVLKKDDAYVDVWSNGLSQNDCLDLASEISV